jgi:hypothetical protein
METNILLGHGIIEYVLVAWLVLYISRHQDDVLDVKVDNWTLHINFIAFKPSFFALLYWKLGPLSTLIGSLWILYCWNHPFILLMSKCQIAILDLVELGLDVEVEEDLKLPKIQKKLCT